MPPCQPSPDATRPHACPVPGCLRRFKRPFTLKEHVKTHTGEKPFVCPVPSCRKSFTTSGNLSRHKHLHPWLDAPYECLIVGCGCTFPSEVKLQRHMNMAHFGASTHLCTVAHCGGAFSTAGNLRRHIKQHHPNVESPKTAPVGGTSSMPPSKKTETTVEPTCLTTMDSPSIQSPVAVEGYSVQPDTYCPAQASSLHLHPRHSTHSLGANDVELLEALGYLFDSEGHHFSAPQHSYIV